MPFKILITVLLIINTFGCAAKHPAWVANGSHPEYPQDQFLVGVGLSSRSRDIQADLQKSDANARLEVAKQLRVKIQSSLTSQKEQKTRSSLPETYTSKTSMDIKEDVELLLAGITIADRYYSKEDKLHYSVAVLNKSQAAKRFSSEITRHSHNAKELSRQSDILLKNGDITGFLHTRIKALDHYRNYISKKQMVAVLDPDAPDSFEAPPADPSNGLIKIKNSIDLIALDGNMQTGRTGRALERPLRVKALYNKTPIDNLPLTARFQGGTGRTEQNIVTGKHGKADIKVLETGKTGRHMNLITVSVDWNSIIKEALETKPGKAWDHFLSGPAVNFKYRLRVPSASNVLIKICNRGGYPNAASILHPTSVDLIRKKGFLIKETGRGGISSTICSGSMGIESIARKYKRLTNILIVETIDVDFSGRRGQGYVFRARMSVTAYDMDYNEIVASMEGEALGGASSRKKAAERAIKEVANELMPQLVSRLAQNI